MKTAVFVAISLALPVLASAQPAAVQTIKAIEVEGNTKTDDDIVIALSKVKEGREFRPEMIDEIKSELVNSGLFKDVQVAHTEAKGGIKLIITAIDKHSWVIAPTYYNQPTNKGGGLGFGENNLFGENKKMIIYGQVATGDSFFIGAYQDPSIRKSRFYWQIDTYILRARSIEYAPPIKYLDDTLKPVRESVLNYYNGGIRVGLNLFRGAKLDFRMRGAKVFYDDTKLSEGAVVEDVTTEPGTTADNLPEPGKEGYDISGEARLELGRLANWYGLSEGLRFRGSFERSLVFLSDDFDYWVTKLRMEWAKRYYEHHNLYVRVTGVYGRDLPFQQELTAGGTAQRGYKNAQFRGDMSVAATLEYSVPLFTIKGVSLRTVGFVDSAYTAFFDTDSTDTFRSYLPGHDIHGAAPFKNTIGGGIRLVVRQVVLPLLGLDVGYGLERGDYEIYLAIGLTDV